MPCIYYLFVEIGKTDYPIYDNDPIEMAIPVGPYNT